MYHYISLYITIYSSILYYMSVKKPSNIRLDVAPPRPGNPDQFSLSQVRDP